MATLLLHSMMFVAATSGDGGVRRLPDRPDAVGSGANSGKPDEDIGERQITVRLISEVEPESEILLPSAQLLQAALRASLLEITGPDSQPLPPLLFEDGGEPMQSTDAELMARAELVGIYESQIRVRIERAWKLPQEFSGERGFTCRVLIRQHPTGRIREVELTFGQCEGSPSLRQSLVDAVFAASPLPTPPHPSVFVDSFSLVFKAGALRDPAQL